jgi:xanthine dehydrogenase accessory factor
MWAWLRKLEELEQRGTPAALVTVVRCAGSTPAAAGAKMVVLESTFFGTVGGGHLEELVLRDARACLASGERKMVRYPLGAAAGQCCGGVVEVFIDVLSSGPELYLFGAGHVAQALCRVLVGTPFIVHAVDEREDWLAALPAEVRRHAIPWDVFVRESRWSTERTYVAIMTHRHDVDEAIVADVALRPAKYLGLIGSTTKWRRFRDRLEARGVATQALDRVKCPIGADIGGKSPSEVAISIAAELVGVHHGRSGSD